MNSILFNPVVILKFVFVFFWSKIVKNSENVCGPVLIPISCNGQTDGDSIGR